MTLTDSCPSCLRRGIAPAATRWRSNRIVHGYRCPRCGATWTTTRDLTAYSDLHTRRTQQPNRKAA
ncbi:hypothetical protein [Streptomyces sparsogenes]|uniref:C2H2-type domain-containing protein n=1 Tax=Streptomyces sparsogenes DSM 40356 TaxID=1331668 RepID=A0A1R1S8C1_9ACTN|nr:hypothetical protein [Streptomyces sparsogenes]OMI34448.1 hypothetical protein SPAR_36731 [Streptomyces sparsogenes DSM 40356]